MKYKFIGTEQDLTENGYIDDRLWVVKPVELDEENGFRACKIINKDNNSYYTVIERFWEKEVLKTTVKTYMCDLRTNEYNSLKNCVLVKNIKPYIQHIIDKGLVVENDLTNKGEKENEISNY